MALQLLNGDLLIVNGQRANSPDCCCDQCPALGSTDWYLYLYPPTLPTAWCPTEDFLDIAINLGTLTSGQNIIEFDDFTCVGMPLEGGCGGDTDFECYRDVSGIAGSPLSGMRAATDIALRLGVTLYAASPQDGLVELSKGMRLRGVGLHGKMHPIPDGPVVLVEDSTCSGTSLGELQSHPDLAH